MKSMLYIIVICIYFFPSFVISSEIKKESQKAILITGASAGLGRVTAEHLAKSGYFVYAGARKDADIQSLNKINNIKAIRLDVTNQDQIDEALSVIKADNRGLWGIVNNAGVFDQKPIIISDIKDLEFQFGVNVFGVFRITKAFAPLVIKSRGRIINISSISGFMSVDTVGVYAATKHALEAMTDSLALELQPFGVHVAAINPGNFKTKSSVTRCQRILQEKDSNWGIFEKRRLDIVDYCRESLESAEKAKKSRPPILVAKAVEQALFEENPRKRYLVASQIGAGQTIAWAIEEILALNNGHEQSYTRDELVQLIDIMWPYMSGEKQWESQDAAWDVQDAWANRELPGKN